MAQEMAGWLAQALRHLGDEFKPNRLAYWSLMTKNEREMSNALAWSLNEQFAGDDDIQVIREWKRHDIAVLRRHNPVALVEAKAAMAFNLVEESSRVYPSKEVLRDIEKLRGAEPKCEECYVLPFFTHVRQIPRHEYDGAMPYISGIRKHRIIEEAELEGGFERFRKAVGELTVVANGAIPAGKAFDVDVSVFYWLLAVPG
ncbi:MAG: hypothetical protein OXQ29_09115 [Rhodospirillaceae bacterium]|nr:hypothetical protein [Rhodospirillaceae bacterium]